MRVLILGSGGREHALAWRLSRDASVIVAPGNPGTADLCETAVVSLHDLVMVDELARDVRADLTIVGPEDPLIAGVADLLRRSGLAVLGPGAEGAEIEGSKAFAKIAMREAGVPTAAHQSFSDHAAALDYARRRFDQGSGLAVKASGAALGKGVVVAESVEEAEDALRRFMVEREFGDAGGTVVLEDRLIGREFSLHVLVCDGEVAALPIAQDYKRLGDGDTGPNTGGMGSVCPPPWVTPELVGKALDRIARPIVGWMRERRVSYRGVLFCGVMVVDGEPMCLEYNARFGDPETQSMVRLVEGDFAHALRAVATGEGAPVVGVREGAAVTVVLTASGYPGAPRRGDTIEIGALPPGVEVFHSGTARAHGRIVTSGGRVLGLSAVGESVAAARADAYAALGAVRFERMQHRTDLGTYQ